MVNTKLKDEKTDASAFDAVIEFLPLGLRAEIKRICLSRADFPIGLSEIRVRRIGRCGLVISGENVPLFTRVTQSELDEIFDKLVDSSLYAHTRELGEGFVTLRGGIRVGVCGELGSSSEIPNKIFSLAFRLPMGRCDFADELYSAWEDSGKSGMLIYSLPGAGKTSALRALAKRISRTMRRVVVVDERYEFIPSDYDGDMVDILRGYSKPRGIEMALRTLGAEVIMVDEIGNANEGESLLRVGRGGVPIIATAHASDYNEVVRKEGIAPLIEEGYFSCFVRLFREGGRFGYSIMRE